MGDIIASILHKVGPTGLEFGRYSIGELPLPTILLNPSKRGRGDGIYGLRCVPYLSGTDKIWRARVWYQGGPYLIREDAAREVHRIQDASSVPLEFPALARGLCSLPRTLYLPTSKRRIKPCKISLEGYNRNVVPSYHAPQTITTSGTSCTSSGTWALAEQSSTCRSSQSAWWQCTTKTALYPSGALLTVTQPLP